MFRTYVVVIEIASFFDCILDDFLGPRRLGQLAHGHHVGTALYELFNLEADLAQVHIQVLQYIRADAASFFHEAEQDMLRADVFVVEALGFLIRKGHHLAGTIRKPFKHVHLL